MGKATSHVTVFEILMNLSQLCFPWLWRRAHTELIRGIHYSTWEIVFLRRLEG